MSHRQYQYPSIMSPPSPPWRRPGPANASFQMVDAGGAVLIRQLQYKGMMKPTFVPVVVATAEGPLLEGKLIGGAILIGGRLVR